MTSGGRSLASGAAPTGPVQDRGNVIGASEEEGEDTPDRVGEVVRSRVEERIYRPRGHVKKETPDRSRPGELGEAPLRPRGCARRAGRAGLRPGRLKRGPSTTCYVEPRTLRPLLDCVTI